MAIIRKNEIKVMDPKVMDTKLKDLRKELIKINAQVAMKTMSENPGRIREIKKTIARILTIKNIKEDKLKSK